MAISFFDSALSVRNETAPRTLIPTHSKMQIPMIGETLKEIKARYPIVEVILLTGHGTIDTAVNGMKTGAFDYLLKPCDHDELLALLEAARKRKVEHEERIRKAEARALSRRTGGT